MLLILNMKLKSAIILTLIVLTSAIYKKYAYWRSSNGRCYFSCFCYDGVQVQTREHVILAKEVGIKYIVVFINKLDSIVEPVMQDLVELEVRELLESYGYPADLPVIKGSARLALMNKNLQQ
jgi:hypothetical protein